MSSLDEVISKIPKPVFVLGVFIIASSLMFYFKPLKNGCDAQISNFENNVKGYLINNRLKNKKIKYAEINTTKDLCKNGNSQGACENYFTALKKISEAFVTFDNQCFEELKEQENFTDLEAQLKNAIKVLALLAWGEKPPSGLSDRQGWLQKTEIYSFCRLKTALLNIIEEENYKKFRMSVYKEYPDIWPEKLQSQINSLDIQRPTAFKWSGNINGTLTESEVFQRSLFSLRCEQYQ